MNTSKSTGLIQLVKNSSSLDAVKKEESFPGSLRKLFEQRYVNMDMLCCMFRGLCICSIVVCGIPSLLSSCSITTITISLHSTSTMLSGTAHHRTPTASLARSPPAYQLLSGDTSRVWPPTVSSLIYWASRIATTAT